MGHDSAKRNAAFEAYVYAGRGLPSISVELKIAEGTLKRWAAEGRESSDGKSWHEMRLAVDADKSTLTAQFYTVTSRWLKKAMRKGAKTPDAFAAIAAFKALSGERPEERELKREEIALKRERIKKERERMEAAASAAAGAAARIAGRSLTPDEIKKIREDVYGIFEAA